MSIFKGSVWLDMVLKRRKQYCRFFRNHLRPNRMHTARMPVHSRAAPQPAWVRAPGGFLRSILCSYFTNYTPYKRLISSQMSQMISKKFLYNTALSD